jgi:putative transposase
LKRDGDQWSVCIVCEIEIVEPVPRDGPVVAIDRGVVNAVGDSTGKDPIPNPRFYEHALHALTRAQRNVSRKKKGSKNQDKAKLRVTRIHRKIRRQRDHFLHTLSSRYAKSHGVVVLEKLNIVGMTKSASGTAEEPGHNVRQKAGLNRSILDAAWRRFAEMLKYKLDWSGGRLEYESAAYSSQTCSIVTCGHRDAKSRVAQSVFRCTACGHTEHADVNASKVLLQRYEARVIRSGQLGEDTVPKTAQRTKKRVVLRVPRRTPESSSKRMG